MKRWMILADDLTGAVDTGAFPVSCNKEVIVYADPEAYSDKEQEIVCVNMGTRSLEKEKAYFRHLCFAEMHCEYDGLIVKKMDMGFRGNPAAEIEALLTGFQRTVCFVVPALPQFKTFTLYGNQYVKGKILEESLYSEDPIHRAKESFVPDIFQKGTTFQLGHVNIDEVKGTRFLQTVKEKLEAGARIIIFDAVSDEDCYRIFQTLFSEYPKAIWAGTLGLLCGLTRTLYGETSEIRTEPKKNRCAGFSGTAYDVTKKQIQYCQERGLAVISLRIKECLETKQREREIRRVATVCMAANQKGDFMVVPEVPSGIVVDELSKRILDALALCADEVCKRVSVNRIVIIGGETANAILHRWSVSEMLIREKPETGMAAGVFLDGIYAGYEFALKGGSVGSISAIHKLLGKE